MVHTHTHTLTGLPDRRGRKQASLLPNQSPQKDKGTDGDLRASKEEEDSSVGRPFPSLRSWVALCCGDWGGRMVPARPALSLSLCTACSLLFYLPSLNVALFSSEN
jgi:hypothetical protein